MYEIYSIPGLLDDFLVSGESSRDLTKAASYLTYRFRDMYNSSLLITTANSVLPLIRTDWRHKQLISIILASSSPVPQLPGSDLKLIIIFFRIPFFYRVRTAAIEDPGITKPLAAFSCCLLLRNSPYATGWRGPYILPGVCWFRPYKLKPYQATVDKTRGLLRA